MGVAVTGAIFGVLQTDKTVSLLSDKGIDVSDDQARELNGLLAGTPGAKHEVEKLADGDVKGAEEVIRESFVEALGTSLKLSAALVLLGLVLAVVLLRRSEPADAAPSAHLAPSVTPRPAPLQAAPAGD
jgi:hypothetical protein